jgi:aminomethyltransferase
MTKHTPVPIGAIPSPVFAQLDALSTTKAWMNWAGYISPLVLDTTEFEYFAIRNQATLFDISPMHKYRVTGPDAERVLNRVVTRNLAKLKPGRVGYALWCDEDGMVIDDGTVFRLGEQDFRLCCQEPNYSWLLDAAFGFDCQIVDESEMVAGFSLQGPTSWSVLSDAGFEMSDMKTFDFREVEPGIWISRTGFTGDLGYELWIDWDKASDLWDRLWAAGKGWGLRAIGYEALNYARIEAGFIAAGVDFQPVHITERLHRGRTPLELGFGRLVHFDKGHFNGRRALLKQQQDGLRYHLKRVEVGGFKPSEGALIYHRKKTEIGHITSGIWSPTAKRNIAQAELKAPYGDTVLDDLWVEIYVYEEGVWEKQMQPLTFAERPFFFNPRSRITPPQPF